MVSNYVLATEVILQKLFEKVSNNTNVVCVNG